MKTSGTALFGRGRNGHPRGWWWIRRVGLVADQAGGGGSQQPRASEL